MVDAAHAGFGETRAPAYRTATAAEVRATVVPATGEALASFAAVARRLPHAPPQSPAWVAHWTDHAARDALIVELHSGTQLVLALPLEVVRIGPFRVARFMGGTHANGNFAPTLRAWAATASGPALRTLLEAMRTARPDIDVLVLARLLPALDGLANPLLALPHFKSANVSLATDLTGGFTALLSRSSGKRKRKKYRSQSRKFDIAGGFRRIEATTPEQVDRILDAFFTMKEARFRKAGIRDVFADAGVRDFFRSLFKDALDQRPPPFVLHALEVGGVLRAATGSSRRGDTLICEFGAIVEDELAGASPGDFLFFENIRDACEQGLGVYDFSVGDEQYKRLWCDIETQHLDVVAPLTMKGRLLSGAVRAYARGKAAIKGNPRVWSMVKRLRRTAAGSKAAPTEASDD